jgi:murein DD-endopeptidase MepM/ murein hydrolase activator NlpD
MGVGLHTRGATAVLIAGVVALSTVGALGAGAQVLPPPSSTTTSSTTSTSDPSSTTTTTPSTTTSTTARPLVTTPSAPSSSTSSSTTTTTTTAFDEPPPALGGDGTAPPESADEFPPELAALTSSVRRTRSNSTKGLLEALAPLSAYGLDSTQQAIIGFGRFPVAGYARWSDDWWLPRFGPDWRLHQGLDIFADFGTPVRAPVDGAVRVSDGGLGGLAVYVTGADYTYWYLAHLSALAPGIEEGVTVRTGQIVGYVGDSGNAKGGAPHLHFEVHPRGRGPVPPKPIVDQFVKDALRLVVPSLLKGYAAQATVLAAQAPVLPELPTGITPRAALLWASSLSPAGGGVRLAEIDALEAARSIDWSRTRSEKATDRTTVRLWLAPLVPGPLQRALG